MTNRSNLALFAVTGLLGLAPMPSANAQGASGAQAAIQWRTSSQAQARAPLGRAGIEEGLAEVVRTPGQRHVVVQLGQQAPVEVREQLAEQGLNLVTSLGSGAWFATVDKAHVSPGAIEGLRALVDVREIELDWKLHPELAAGITPRHSIVGRQRSADPRVAAYVVFHADVPLEPDARGIAEAHGARVVDTVKSTNMLVVELKRSDVSVLASVDEVQWIEPPLPRMSNSSIPNDSNRAITQADLVQAVPYSLDGSGVTVLVYDGGTARATHVDFGGRCTSRDSSGTSFHATHVAGTIGGDGTTSSGTFAGMAPGVTIESYGFEFDGTGTFLYSNPGDFESDYGDAINLYGADISNNSIGSNTEPNGFPCNYQGDYGLMAATIDAVVRGSLGAPFRIVWSAGNERGGNRCDLEGHGDYYSMGPPAGNKNAILVGALNSNDDSMTSFSSWGPTDDGRLKPDIAGPGCQAGGDGGVTSLDSASDTAQTTLCGTSMSGPTVAGLCALILEDYRVQFGGADPRNSTLKALLAQNAVDLGNTGPDYQFGFGSVRVKDTIDDMRLGNFAQGTLGHHGATQRYTVNVSGGDPELKLTLSWDDVAGTPNVLPALVNDLDLRVFAPGGARHYPWTLDPANPAAAAVQSAEDHANNIEQVFVNSPTAGTWTIEIQGFDVPSGPQPFSLISSHALTQGAFVELGVVGGIPSVLTPGVGETVLVRAQGFNDTVVPGSVTLHVRYEGDAFIDIPMSFAGINLFQAELPPAVCSATPEFYFSAQGTTSGAVTAPPAGATAPFTSAVQVTTLAFSDSFNFDTGWTVTNDASLIDGPWERGVPAGGGGRSDPATDFDGSGSCYLTDNVSGNSDVDGGPTTLTSPVFDLSAGLGYTIGYARWMANDDFDIDRFDTEITDDGVTWVPVESVLNTNGWQERSIVVTDFVSETSTVQVRFLVTDDPNDSVTEAALDAFRIDSTSCANVLADCDGNGIVDSDDIASGRETDYNQNGTPDSCESGRISFEPTRQ